jgi:hypothetical protein
MHNFIKFFITTFCLFHFISVAFADTHNAASCSRADVNSAISAASTNDTVIIPAGSCNWSSGITLTKQITIQGNGIGSTIITSTGANPIFDIDGAGNFRITGIEFNGNGASMAIYIAGYGRVAQPTARFRIDHCKFVRCVSRAIEMEVDAYGVIHNCQFLNGAISEICIYRADFADGADSWGQPTDLGTDRFVFVEDCTFNVDSNYATDGGDPWNHAITANHGARYVFRHNTITLGVSLPTPPDPIDAHGNYYYGRGTRAYEIYENKIYGLSGNIYLMMDIRGGTGVIYNNTWDTNDKICLEEDASGSYPIQDQVGRGQNNNLEPLYIWGNTSNTVTNDDPSVIQLNRDYYVSAKPGYTAYTYPHPLRGGGGGDSAPAAPRGLQISP